MAGNSMQNSFYALVQNKEQTQIPNKQLEHQCKCTNNNKANLGKKVSEYDQEIPQSQTADKPMTTRGRTTQQLRDTRKKTKQSNQLSLLHLDENLQN